MSDELILKTAKEYGKDLAYIWVSGYHAACEDMNRVDCAVCAHFDEDISFCKLMEFGAPDMFLNGFCSFGDIDATKEDSVWR